MPKTILQVAYAFPSAWRLPGLIDIALILGEPPKVVQDRSSFVFFAKHLQALVEVPPGLIDLATASGEDAQLIKGQVVLVCEVLVFRPNSAYGGIPLPLSPSVSPIL